MSTNPIPQHPISVSCLIGYIDLSIDLLPRRLIIPYLRGSDKKAEQAATWIETPLKLVDSCLLFLRTAHRDSQWLHFNAMPNNRTAYSVERIEWQEVSNVELDGDGATSQYIYIYI